MSFQSELPILLIYMISAREPRLEDARFGEGDFFLLYCQSAFLPKYISASPGYQALPRLSLARAEHILLIGSWCRVTTSRSNKNSRDLEHEAPPAKA